MESFQFLGEEIWGVENAGWDGLANIAGMDIPDASTYLRNFPPVPSRSLHLVGNFFK